jgi:hypothetical protein
MNVITLRSLVLLGAVTVSLAASGQSPEVLKGEAITESALVEALTPAPAPVLTRSIDRNAAPAAAPKPAKAALLITFETNATVLTADAKRELDIGSSAEYEPAHRLQLQYRRPRYPRGSAERNLRLSEGRASVKQYLVQNQSVSAERLRRRQGDREPLIPPMPPPRGIVASRLSTCRSSFMQIHHATRSASGQGCKHL